MIRRTDHPTYRWLFGSGKYLSDHLEGRRRSIANEVDALAQNQILNVSESDLIDHLEAKFRLEPLALHADRMEIHSVGETDVPISDEIPAALLEYTDPAAAFRKGRTVTFAIPYTGDDIVFYFCPSGIPAGWEHIYGSAAGGEVHLLYIDTDHDKDGIETERDRDLAKIRRYLESAAPEIDAFNSGLRAAIQALVAERKKRLLDDAGLVAAFNIPVRERPGIPKTYAPPIREKLTLPPRPEPSPGAFRPEPTLPSELYEKILALAHGMTVVMEQHPDAFETLDEEAIRSHFLLRFQDAYELDATGETFNHGGKTDILLRHEGANIFVSECKFWRGPKYLLEGIAQLLGNVTWRDTKTALFVFNRDGNLSHVLEQIEKHVPEAPCFKKLLSKPGETEFRYLFHHPSDKNRDVYVAILVFEVPGPDHDAGD